MTAGHYPVLLEESVEALVRDPGPVESPLYIDATFGGGGHTRRILEKLPPDGRVLAVDRDPEAAERASELQRDRRFVFAAGTYDEVLGRLVSEGVRASGILFDLGLSSFQVDDPGRGFSYVNDGPLDMRMDPTTGISAADFVNDSSEQEMLEVLRDYGDVSGRDARRIVRVILERRPLNTTSQMSEAVREAIGWSPRGGNPSRRVFQAIRVHINDEPGSLRRALTAAEKLLVPEGRLVVITFQSGEDRIVKRFIADGEGKCVCPPELPVCVCGAKASLRRVSVSRPRQDEVDENPRSASARMRVAVRTAEPPRSSDDGMAGG